MTDKAAPQNNNDQPKIVHPGMMGDGSEEQNLNEKGNSAVRIRKDDVNAAFEKQSPKKD